MVVCCELFGVCLCVLCLYLVVCFVCDLLCDVVWFVVVVSECVYVCVC